jgi:hypothetical protein
VRCKETLGAGRLAGGGGLGLPPRAATPLEHGAYRAHVQAIKHTRLAPCDRHRPCWRIVERTALPAVVRAKTPGVLLLPTLAVNDEEAVATNSRAVFQ